MRDDEEEATERSFRESTGGWDRARVGRAWPPVARGQESNRRGQEEVMTANSR